jgi:hypothetical protein
VAAPFRLIDFGAAASIHFEVAFDSSTLQGTGVDVAGFMVRHVDCQDLATPEHCFRVIGTALDFPGENTVYGHNPNAFLDWLTDLGWVEDLQGILVVLHSSHILWARWPYSAGVLLEVWLRAADSWGRSRIPCHLVFDLPAE